MQIKSDDLVQKLDLKAFISSFSDFFSREKPLYIEGDQNRHFKFIDELNKYEFNAPKNINNLDTALMHLKKQGVLSLKDIFSFLSIVRYFKYLQTLPFENVLLEWINEIRIPDYFGQIDNLFNEKGEFNHQADEQLRTLQINLERNKDEVRGLYKKLLFSKKLQSYLIDTQIHYIQSSEALLMRPGFNHILDGSIIGRSSAGHFYVVPESSQKLNRAKRSIEQEIEAVLYEHAKDISKEYTKNLQFLKFINREFDRFDHYQARVHFASSKNLSFIKPQNDDKIILSDFKHPALNKAKSVSVDFSKSILMITGVNAGGKTMLLKSILSATFLGKYLIPMPINPYKSHIGTFKKIMPVIDDPQSVQNDISTFAGRMQEFSNLLKERSILIGVDEIELGTDSDEAAALFKVLLEQLMQRQSKVIITTHHKRLAALMAFHDEVALMAALYNEKERRPTYEFLQGIIGKSYAFESAQRYGIPQNLINEAKKVYGDDQEKLNELIERSSELELNLKSKTVELERRLNDVKESQRELKEEKENLYTTLVEQKRKLDGNYYGAITDAKKAAREHTLKETHRMMTKAHKQLPKKEIEKEITEKLQVGDSVKYRQNRGVVISLKSKEAQIEIDGIRLRVPIKELKLSKKLKKPAPKVTIQRPKEKRAAIKLDLHGQRAEEAIENLDRFLSDALLQGSDEILVYHGIGTGKLAFAVKEFLKSHPSVIGFEDAPPNMGGYGAKIIKI